MTVFSFVLARDKPDQHQLCRFLIVFPLGTRHPSIFFFFQMGTSAEKEGLGPVHQPSVFTALDLGVEGLKPSTTGPSGFISDN